MAEQEKQAFINLVEMMGGDLAVVNSARVSYGKSSAEMDERGERLIGRLLREHHGTPFEQSVFTFYVKCPIFVAREWFRHRMGSFNEISGRYKVLNTEFYTPRKFRVKDPEREQMAYKYKDAPLKLDADAREKFAEVYAYVGDMYDYLIASGVANEHARIILPVGIYTEFRWTVNARSLMNFLTLRNSLSAMQEIRVYAAGIENIFKQEMPITYQAFEKAERVAP